MERPHPCFKCEHKCEMPEDRQIQCNNPPDVQAFVHHGEKGTKLAREVMEKLKENVVIRVAWSASGRFPFSFDGATVILCSNFKETKA